MMISLPNSWFLQGKKLITKEYTNIFFNRHNKKQAFIYSYCDFSYNNTGEIRLDTVEFKSYFFKFQKLKKLKKIANQENFICWCPFYPNNVDDFWLNIRKEKLQTLQKIANQEE